MGAVYYTTYSLQELAQAALREQYTEEVKRALATITAEFPTQMYVRVLEQGSASPTWIEHSFTVGSVHNGVKQRYPGAHFLIQATFDEYVRRQQKIQQIAQLTGFSFHLCAQAVERVAAYYHTTPQDEIASRIEEYVRTGDESRAVVIQFREEIDRLQPRELPSWTCD